MSKIVYFICIIFMLEWRLMDCVSYIPRSDLNDCDYLSEIDPIKGYCFKAKTVDACAELMNCYPNAKYFTFDVGSTYCACEAYMDGGCEYNQYRSFKFYDIYEITSFDECKTGVDLWLFSIYFGSIDWGVFGVGQAFGFCISGFAIYYFIYKKERRKKFNELNNTGIVTNATVFSGFVTWITVTHTQNGTTTTRHYGCSIYYEANSATEGLCAVRCPKFEISASHYFWLTSSTTVSSYPDLVKEGITIVYDPNDIQIWFFEKDMNKSLNEAPCTCCMKFASIMYIIAVIGTPIFCLWLSWQMAYDAGNFTAPLLVLFTTAIGWPLLYYLLHLSCWDCCMNCSKTKFKIEPIGESKLPHLQANITNNGNTANTQQPIALTTNVQMSQQYNQSVDAPPAYNPNAPPYPYNEGV